MLDPMTMLAIGATALLTYSLRFGGLMLAENLPRTERSKRFMDALPGTILLSLVAPGILDFGFWGIVGSGLIVVIVFKTRNVFAAMLIGMLVVAISRQFA